MSLEGRLFNLGMARSAIRKGVLEKVGNSYLYHGVAIFRRKSRWAIAVDLDVNGSIDRTYVPADNLIGAMDNVNFYLFADVYGGWEVRNRVIAKTV